VSIRILSSIPVMCLAFVFLDNTIGLWCASAEHDNISSRGLTPAYPLTFITQAYAKIYFSTSNFNCTLFSLYVVSFYLFQQDKSFSDPKVPPCISAFFNTVFIWEFTSSNVSAIISHVSLIFRYLKNSKMLSD